MSGIWRFLERYDIIAFLIMSVCEFIQRQWISGLGWLMAAFGWYAWNEEKKFYDMLADLYRKHLRECKCNNETKDEDEKKDND